MPDPAVEVKPMESFLDKLLCMDALAAQRQDHNVARQAVVNNTLCAHLMSLSFTRDATELSIPESLAIQSMGPREATLANLAVRTPLPATP